MQFICRINPALINAKAFISDIDITGKGQQLRKDDTSLFSTQSAIWFLHTHKRSCMNGTLEIKPGISKGRVQALHRFVNRFRLIMKQHANNIEARRVNPGIKAARLIHKDAYFFYLLIRHIAKKVMAGISPCQRRGLPRLPVSRGFRPLTRDILSNPGRCRQLTATLTAKSSSSSPK